MHTIESCSWKNVNVKSPSTYRSSKNKLKPFVHTANGIDGVSGESVVQCWKHTSFACSAFEKERKYHLIDHTAWSFIVQIQFNWKAFGFTCNKLRIQRVNSFEMRVRGEMKRGFLALNLFAPTATVSIMFATVAGFLLFLLHTSHHYEQRKRFRKCFFEWFVLTINCFHNVEYFSHHRKRAQTHSLKRTHAAYTRVYVHK